MRKERHIKADRAREEGHEKINNDKACLVVKRFEKSQRCRNTTLLPSHPVSFCSHYPAWKALDSFLLSPLSTRRSPVTKSYHCFHHPVAGPACPFTLFPAVSVTARELCVHIPMSSFSHSIMLISSYYVMNAT